MHVFYCVQHVWKEAGHKALFHTLKPEDDRAVLELHNRRKTPFISWLHSRQGISEEDAADWFQDSANALWNNVLDGKLKPLRSSMNTY